MPIYLIEGFTQDLGIPAEVVERSRSGCVELYNAARPFPAHETYTGEFLHGVFYGIIDPAQDYADDYRKRATELDASRVVFVSRDDIMSYGRNKCWEYGRDPEDFTYEQFAKSWLGWRRREETFRQNM